MKDEKFQEFVKRLKEEMPWFSMSKENVLKTIDKLAEEFLEKECGK